MAIQIRRGTDANFNANSESIVEGEPIITTDTERFAVGVSNGTYAEFTNTEVIASEYSTSSSYSEGDYCTYQGKLYQAIAQSGGAWNATAWTQIVLTDEIVELQGRATALETSVNALGNVANLTYTVVSTF